MYKALQQQVKPQMLLIMLVALTLLAITASYLYVIKQPLQEMRQSQQTLELLQNEVDNGAPVQSQNDMEMQQKLIDQLNVKLHGTGPKLPVNQMVAYVIGELDRIAGHHQVTLSSVKPESPQSLFTFREMPFQVEISGDYFNLFAWLKDIEQELGPIIIKQFDITPSGSTVERRMVLTLVAYQFEDDQ